MADAILTKRNWKSAT